MMQSPRNEPAALESEEEIRWGEYLLAIRLRLGIYGFLGVVAFMFYFREGVSWPCVGAGFVATMLISSIMVWNDYVDRVHDAKKGRTLASRDPRAFLLYVVLVWGLTLSGIGSVFVANRDAGWILIFLAVIGCLYGWFRTVPFLSGISVALSFAGLVLLASAFAPEVERDRVGLLFVCVMAMAYGRENLADLEDVGIDQGYKATLPVMLGEGKARTLIRFCTLFSIGLACWITPWAFVVVPFTVWVFLEMRNSELAFGKIQKIYDVQSVGFMLLLPWI
ncbi:MAG: UbiA family prenyltransferase [Planctomycetota bacterium]|jgi:4-hydroxybenzoate polyprenyltransferase|nr:UbiA family prenyltransferase [Planctomycetota bacterium]